MYNLSGFFFYFICGVFMLTMCMQRTQGLKEGIRAGVTGNFEHLLYSGS